MAKEAGKRRLKNLDIASQNNEKIAGDGWMEFFNKISKLLIN